MPGSLRTIELHASPGCWRLFSALPDPDLSGMVREYWEVQGNLGPFREKVLPNGCVELMVNLGPVHRTLKDKDLGTWDRAWLSGLQDRALLIESLQGTHLVAARLHPLGARDLLGACVPETAGTVVDLSTLVGSHERELRERLLAAGSPRARFHLLESFLRRRLSGRPSRDIVRWAASRIEATHGSLRIAKLHDELGVSRKHLAIVFARDMGVSPKVYARIQRFAWVVERIQDSARVNWSELAGRAGYSDQSHLIRDFQRVAAANPTEFLRSRAPDGTMLFTDEW
jgi:AraC-like DNA-binding protein